MTPTHSPAAPQPTMQAVVKTGPGESLEIGPVPRPSPSPQTVEVQVSATGICGTDVHILKDEYAHETPVILGHEITGRVTRAGSEQDGEWVGRRVACETYFTTCEHCLNCRRGRRNLCRRRRSIGSFAHGGFADFVEVPTRNLHEIPEWLDDVEGALMEPLACVAQCLMDPAVVQPGDAVLVTGPGTMGVLAGQVARAAGGNVTVVGLEADAPRLQIAEVLGLQTTTAGIEESSHDVVVECSGKAGGAAAALRAASRGGRYVQVGIFGEDVSLPADQILYKELLVSSGFASTAASWRRALRLVLDRQVTLAPLVSRRVPLEEFLSAVRAAERGEGMKTVVVPTQA